MTVMYEIRTPVPGYTGHVVGVDFTDGVGRTGEPNLIAYFQRQGYGVEPVIEGPVVSPEPEPELVVEAPGEPEPVPAPTGRRSKHAKED